LQSYFYGVPNSLDSLFTIVVVKFSFFASFFLLLIAVEKWITMPLLNKPYQGFDSLNFGENALDYKNQNIFLSSFATLY
jgi:hypothetical protein